MPVVRFSADEANRNLRRNRASLWPDGRVSSDRLADLAKVSFNPSFTFSRKDRILTIGSCFAREIEHRLGMLNFDLPMKQISIPAEERYTKTENDIISKFTVQSMENELNWSLGETQPPPPESLFLLVGEDLWHDPQLVNNTRPGSLERVIERRAMVQDAVGQAPSCRVVIITLGLAEAWFDHETSLYLNTAPPQPAIRRQPERFSLDVLAYDDILQSLERIHALLTRRGHPDFKILITVSPVPFKATFTGEDALTANTYSKAVQRAACQAFVAAHDNVDYFPSFEIVSLSKRELVYERDNVHIGASTVAYIVDNVLTQYAPDVEFTHAKVGTPKSRRETAEDNHYDLLVMAKHHFAQGDADKAVATYESLFERHEEQMSDRDRSNARSAYGSLLMKLKRWPAAAEQLELAVKWGPADAENWHKLSRTYARIGRRKEAQAALLKARRISPEVAEYRAGPGGLQGLPGPAAAGPYAEDRAGRQVSSGLTGQSPPPGTAATSQEAAAPDPARRLWEKSQASFRRRDYRRSAGLMQALIRGHGEDAAPVDAAVLRLTLGVVLLRLRETSAGVAEIQRSIALDPTVARAHNKLGTGLARLGRNAEALPCFERSVQMAPDKAEYHWRLGEQLRRLQRPQEARASFERCLALEPDHAGARQGLAALSPGGGSWLDRLRGLFRRD